jgi:methylmalonyl-CoA mutase
MTFDFPSISKQAWLDKIETDLKGKSLDSLDWQLSSDLSISPIASREDLDAEFEAIQSRGDNNWFILEEITATNPKDANSDAIQALEGGATALSFTIPETVDFDALLKDINLEWIFIQIKGSEDVAKSFHSYLAQSSFNNEKIKGVVENGNTHFGDYPIIKTHGIVSSDVDNPDDELANLLIDICQGLITDDSNSVHNTWLTIHLTNSFYVNVCKLRAIKLLWPLLCRGFGITEPTRTFIKAKMNLVSDDKTDQDYAKIQAASQAMAAAIGGADIIHLPPTNSTESIAFHRRIARNVNHLMQLESFMHRVEDPAAGSYYIEHMTDKLASSAWKKFQHKYENL